MNSLSSTLSRFAESKPIAQRVIGASMKVHRALGCGFLESVYRNALAIELRKLGITFELHPTLSVSYEGETVGEFQADLVIEHELIVELKVAETLAPVHSSQLINYLVATGIDEGLLLNFGAKSLQFRTKSRLSPPRSNIESQLLP
jgi:GxxExxY protein